MSEAAQRAEEMLLSEGVTRLLEDVENLKENVYVTSQVAEELSMRQFDTGATRDGDTGKWDFEGFLSPAVLWEFARFMHGHRVQTDGNLRDSDNWQKGIPLDAYMKSLLRHVFDLWMLHRGFEPVRPETGEKVGLAESLGGVMFNVQGYWHEVLKADAFAAVETP